MTESARKINVLYVEPTSGFGGSSRCLAMILDHLDKQKYHPILALRHDSSYISPALSLTIYKLANYSSAGNQIYYLWKVFCEFIQFIAIIVKERISLVHVNTNIILGIPTIMAARLTGRKCICYIRETRPLIKRERWIASWVDKIIVLNEKGRTLYEKDLPAGKVVVIPDGIDCAKFQEVERGHFRKEKKFENNALVGLVGRIVRGKGQKEFVLAAKKVLRQKSDVKFLIIGEAIGENDEYYREVKALVENEALTADVIFTGWRNDVNRVIADLDILVQGTTTFPEGFGLTIVEAMALGKPVIATDIPGPSEIVLDDITGYLIPPGNIDVMAEKTLYLLNNPPVAQSLGAKGRERAEKFFDVRNVTKRLEALYMEVLEKTE